MKYVVFLFLLNATNLKAQTVLNFNKRFVESEDKWVAFQKDKDSSYMYGFIYIDAQAGLTLNYEGNFKISLTGEFIPKKIDSTNFKIRLNPNDIRVAFIPENKFQELNVPISPAWLKYYKKDTASIERLYRWGFFYNSWDECEKALTYLERAQKINPAFKGLALELAFAYNALEQYEKAITVLENVIEKPGNNCYLYKELSYAQMHIGQLYKASQTGKKGISLCSDKQIKSEIAYNFAYEYYTLKDEDNFKYWADETKKWATKGDRFMTTLNKLEADFEKQ